MQNHSRKKHGAADFVRMLDSGIQISDFLTAIEPCTNTRPIDFS
jgi:hypothetical protein